MSTILQKLSKGIAFCLAACVLAFLLLLVLKRPPLFPSGTDTERGRLLSAVLKVLPVHIGPKTDNVSNVISLPPPIGRPGVRIYLFRGMMKSHY